MGTIRFVAPGFSETIRLEAQPQSRTLLAIALEHGIPILFNCEAGSCGACIVHVALRDGGTDLELTFEEEFLLRAMGKLEDGLEADAVDGQRRFRLACQYVVGEEDIVVDFTNELGGA